MKILYAEDNEDLRELFSMKLELASKAEIISVASGNEAIKVLSVDPTITMVICDYTMPDGDGVDVYKTVRRSFSHMPFVLFSGLDIEAVDGMKTFRTDHPGNGLINKPPQKGELEEVLKKAMESMGNGTIAIAPEVSTSDEAQATYIPMKIKFFINMNLSPVEVFIRLSEQKYVKVINADEPYSTEQMQKYFEKGVKDLYLKEGDANKFSDFCLDSMVKLLMVNDTKEETAVQVQEKVHEMVHNQLLKVGMTEHTMAMMKGSIQSTMKVIDTTPSLASLLKKVMSDGGYIYQHSLFISYLAGAVLKKVDWGSEDTKIKVMTAAFLHDSAFDNHDLARISDISFSDVQKLEKRDIEIVMSHPLKAADLTKGLRNFPPDIDAIIAQHHERPDGTGYPRQLSSLRIAPLAAVFIATHHIVSAVYRDGFSKEARERCLKEMETTFNTGNFKKPLEGLLKVFAEDITTD